MIVIYVLWLNLPFPTRLPNFSLNPLTIDLSKLQIPFKQTFSTRTQLGLDLKGGSHLVFQSDTSKINSSDVQDALNSARDIIERRVNAYGVSEPVIQTVKTGSVYRITVDLPGVTDVQQAVNLIGQTAQLVFRQLDQRADQAATPSPFTLGLEQDTGLTGKDVKKASVVFDQQSGLPQISLAFSEQGKKLFAQATEKNIGKPIGIFIDQNLISAPVVQQKIADGNAVITGNFTVEEAKQLATKINSGALPLPISLVEQRNIGPTLGEREVRLSVVAGVVGLSMVIIFMIVFYGRLGMIATLGLIIYGMISFAIFRLLGIVLTLPGIAGFILSIGMAVDANILIFERIKEEQRKGKSFAVALKLGFGRAIDAIKDANITTLLVAFILFNPLNWEFLPQFGLVKGFALTLAIGVGTSLFTGIFITRKLISFFYKT